MTNSVNSFKQLDQLFAEVFGQQDEYFTDRKEAIMEDGYDRKSIQTPKKEIAYATHENPAQFQYS